MCRREFQTIPAKFDVVIGKTVLMLVFVALASIRTMAQNPVFSDSTKTNFEKLLDLSFEDLMNVSVITPTQSLQKSKQAPATVIVVTAEQIKLRGYRNIAEVVNDLPDFIVNDRSDPQFFNVVGIRGIFKQDYFVVLLDGVRISSPTNEPLPLLENFPIYLARQIEVVYGPGSALYGADAMSGVINIITQKAGEQNTLTANVMGGTQGYTNASAVFHKSTRNNLRFSVGGQYSYDAQPDFSKIYKDEYNMSSHRTGVFNSAFGPITPVHGVGAEYETPIKAYNLYTSLDKDGFSLKFLHHYVAVPSSTTYLPDNAVHNKDVFYGHGMTTTSASYTASMGKVKSVSTLVSSLYEVNPRSNFRNLLGGMEHGYKYSIGSMLKAEEQLTFTISEKVALISGLTYEFFMSLPKTPELQHPVDRTNAVSGILLNSITENNPGGIEMKFYPLRYTNVGAYVQAQYFPIDALSLTAGVRYDNNSRFGSTINPRIGAVFNPFETTTLKALYGTAFWAPSPLTSFETYGSFYSADDGNTYQSAFWHLPNPDLKPMTSQTFELSVMQKIGRVFSATFTAYKTQVDNLIQDVADNGHTNLYNNRFQGWHVDYIQVPFNEGRQTNYGGNLKINSVFKVGRADLNVYSSISYLEGKETNTNLGGAEVEEAQVVPWQFRAGMDGKIQSFHFSARLLNAGRQRVGVFEEENDRVLKTIPGYSLLNISAGYTVKKATFYINLQNALNQRYQQALSSDASEVDRSYQNPARAMIGVRVGL